MQRGYIDKLPVRPGRKVATEILARHPHALWGTKETSFLGQMIDLGGLPTRAQAKWLNDIAARAGVQPWQRPTPPTEDA